MRILEHFKDDSIRVWTIISFIPLIISAGLLRSYTRTQAPIITSDILLTIAAAIFASIILIASSEIEERINHGKDSIILYINSLVLFSILSQIGFTHSQIERLSSVLIVFTGVLCAELLVLRIIKKDLISIKFILPVSAHFFDSVTTIKALEYGARELNPIIRLANSLIGDYSIILVKIAFIVPSTLYIVAEEDNIEYSNLLILIITALGIGLGVGNIF